MIPNLDKDFVANVLVREKLHWEVDAKQLFWLRAAYEGEWLYMKINSAFPEGSAYFLVLSDGGSFEFDDFPSEWSRGPLKWPDTART